jgi:hypothetical protein
MNSAGFTRGDVDEEDQASPVDIVVVVLSSPEVGRQNEDRREALRVDAAPGEVCKLSP